MSFASQASTRHPPQRSSRGIAHAHTKHHVLRAVLIHVGLLHELLTCIPYRHLRLRALTKAGEHLLHVRRAGSQINIGPPGGGTPCIICSGPRASGAGASSPGVSGSCGGERSSDALLDRYALLTGLDHFTDLTDHVFTS